MSRRTRQVLLPLLPALLVLAACGDNGETTTSGSLDSVSVTGTVGKSVEVKWDGELSVDKITSEVLSQGEGPEVADGDKLLAHIWIGNGFTQEEAFSTYEQKKPELLTVESGLSKVFLEAIQGRTIGSRVAVAAPAKDAFGEAGNPQIGIGNKDTVLVIADLVSGVLEGPEGADRKPASWAPEIVEKDGVPTGFDFASAPGPSDKLRSTTLVEGEGAVVEKGQTIVANYLGQVHGGKKPFDENYSTGQPTAFQVGAGMVIKGWDRTLVGATIGSRMVLAIPPDAGYGEKGNPQAGIKGTDTLYFLVDILAAG